MQDEQVKNHWADYFFQAIKVASDQKNKEQVAKQKKEKELSKVKISKEDVDLIVCTVQPVHEISNNVVCATSKASDQPAHTGSLIRAFASRFSILW